jgi:hypothetical protein
MTDARSARERLTNALRRAESAQVEALVINRADLRTLLADPDLEALRASLTSYDAEVSKCPVRKARRSIDVCPRCRATSSEGCGLDAGASHRFIEEVRRRLAGEGEKP